jgi:hypothetical protein
MGNKPGGWQGSMKPEGVRLVYDNIVKLNIEQRRESRPER